MSRGKTVKTVKKFLIAAEKEKISNIIHQIIPAASATTGPPLGPMLGQRGIPIAKFVKDFNEKTKNMKKGAPIPTQIKIDGRNYEIEISSPSIEYFIRQAGGIKPPPPEAPPPSKNATNEKVEEDIEEEEEEKEEEMKQITFKHVYEIAQMKIKDRYYTIRDYTLPEMCEEVTKICHEMDVDVVLEMDKDEILDNIGNDVNVKKSMTMTG